MLWKGKFMFVWEQFVLIILNLTSSSEFFTSLSALYGKVNIKLMSIFLPGIRLLISNQLLLIFMKEVS